MESKQPFEDSESAAKVDHVLADMLTRLCDIDQKVDHIIETIHDHLYRDRGGCHEGEVA